MKTLVLIFLLTAPPAIAADCPTSCVTAPVVGAMCTTDAVLDTTLAATKTGFQCNNSFHAVIDTPDGKLYLASGSPFGGCIAQVDLVDDFVLHGTAGPSTMVTFTLRVDGSWNCPQSGAGIDLSLFEGASNQTTVHWDPQSPNCSLQYALVRSGVLSLPVILVPESPVRIRATLAFQVGELQGIELDGRIGVEGLPSGAWVTSCKGFIEGPVAARPASWGRVKASYR